MEEVGEEGLGTRLSSTASLARNPSPTHWPRYGLTVLFSLFKANSFFLVIYDLWLNWWPQQTGDMQA